MSSMLASGGRKSLTGTQTDKEIKTRMNAMSSPSMMMIRNDGDGDGGGGGTYQNPCQFAIAQNAPHF